MKRALGFAAAVLLAASPAPAEERPFDMSNGSCTGRSGTRRLTVSPMRYRDIGLVLPYGLMIGGHVTPIDHMYLSPADVSLGRDVYDVRAIADATIVSVGTRAHDGAHEYRLVFEHSCSFWSYFDLVTSLAPHVLRAMRWTAGREGYWSGRIPVEAGETIGRIGGQTLDFGVYNAELLLPGFVKPAHYVVEDWKVHTDDPFLYFRPAVRDRLLALDVREAEPRAGRIDHDVDGRLRGNWFREGTGFYEGTCERGYGGCDYWGGHLAFAPDGIDPTHLRVSVGDWAGEAT